MADNKKRLRKARYATEETARKILGHNFINDQFGLAGKIGFWIANNGRDSSHRPGWQPRQRCSEDEEHYNNETRLQLFEKFRDLFQASCNTVGGKWDKFTIGNGKFVDRGSYSDWDIGQCIEE